jgi:molecular chaperone DnaJ
MGVPHLKGGGCGDQYVRVKIVVPKNLTPKQRALFEEFAKTLDENPRSALPKSLRERR